MQRFSAFWSTRDRPKSLSASNAGTNAGLINAASNNTTNINALTRRYGPEDYWPSNLDRESEKAARILQALCTDGYVAPQLQDDGTISKRSSTTSLTPKKKIPPRIVQNAVGLAIFSCMRSGLWKSGSGGSGILIARKSDGRWSPPSAFLLHTAALGFVIGVDVYDCVLVINSMSDLEMFTRPMTTLGADVQLAVGPVIADGRLENELRGKDPGRTVLTYVRARGEHRAVNIDGSSVAERGSENERFYGRSVSVLDILAGEVHREDVPEIKLLYEVLKCAEGRVDFDAALLEKLALQPAPGDAMIDISSSTLSLLSPAKPAFGVPDVEDPDPFGVKALEMAGLEIREAGTRHRPPSSQFEYNPSPTSPFFGQPNHRQSTDTYITQSNRGSYMSNRTTFSRMTDAFTQTTVDTRGTTPTSDEGVERASMFEKLPVVREPEEIEYSQETVVEDAGGEAVDLIVMVDKDAASVSAAEETRSPISHQKRSQEEAITQTTGTVLTNAQEDALQEASDLPGDDRGEDADDEDEDSDADIDPAIEEDHEDEIEDEDEDEEEEPVVFEVARASQPPRAAILSSQVAQIIHAKGALVNIPKRVVPAIPARSPARTSRCSKSEFGEIPMKSPLRNSFQSTMTSKSEDGVGYQSLDGVADASSEVTTNVTPASPLKQDAETPEQASEEQSSSDHRRDSASIHTADIENRLSMDPEDFPKTPSTLHTSGQTSSGDEQEPRTPIRQPEDEVSPAEDEKKVSADEEVRSFAVGVEAN
ncbi:SH3 domain-containing YSC84-like protein 1 [Cytospora mali]|uniref:SH3 domain-containing YSC84-like protein 1 n=1 Tax=Cytospora mali TaxID=578113 RepID=A0A194UU56_CYTMA|nr:SH3 domain-containing YSC84-like protein 1 [Valsa mali var. pyri (nom. inval.)]